LSWKCPTQSGCETCKYFIEIFYLNRCKKLDEKIAPGDNSRPFISAYKSYGNGGVEHLVVGNFGEINKGFKQFIAETAILAGSQSGAVNMTPVQSVRA